MGFMDKVKSQAEQIAKQGQDKLDDMQAKKAAEGLLRHLGAWYYAVQTGRDNGQGAAELARITAELQSHEAEHGPLGGGGEAEGAEAAPAPPAGAPAAAPPALVAAAGAAAAPDPDSPSVELQLPVVTDRDGCEELLYGLLWTRGLVVVPLDEAKGVYEVLSVHGQRAREFGSRCVQRTPEQVLARPALRQHRPRKARSLSPA